MKSLPFIFMFYVLYDYVDNVFLLALCMLLGRIGIE